MRILRRALRCRLPRRPARGTRSPSRRRSTTRYDPMRADTMVAVNFAPGTTRLDAGQVNELRTMVATGRRAQRDEFVVVTGRLGRAVQQSARPARRAQPVGRRRALGRHARSSRPWRRAPTPSSWCARSTWWASTTARPTRPSTIGNPNESADAGLRLRRRLQHGPDAGPAARRRGRPARPARPTARSNAAAVARYREGKVPAPSTPPA